MSRRKSKSKSNGKSEVFNTQLLKTELKKLLDIINNIVDMVPDGRKLVLRTRTFKTKSKGHEYEYKYWELFEGYGHNTRFLKRWRDPLPKEVEDFIKVERMFCELKGLLLSLRYVIETFLGFDTQLLQNSLLMMREIKQERRVLNG